MKTRIFISCFLGMCCLGAFAQYLTNPSFEGQKGMSVIPPGWTFCDEYSTPDTQPGINSVNNTPTDGNSFVSLVSRGEPAPSVGHAEDCETKLLKPLLKGKCYKFQADVCSSKTYSIDNFGDPYFYTGSLLLRIYGETSSCAKTELFYTSGTISNADWQTIEFIIVPKQDLNYLYLQSDFTQLPYYFGNVLVDNIRLKDEGIDDFVKLDTVLSYGESIQLASSGGITYSWSPTENLSCSSCQNPLVTFSNSASYTVMITDQNFCRNHKEYFTIVVKPFIPNVITPNGDGWNDTFRILGLEPNSSLSISNRQGEVLYKNDNYDNSWNGTYKGTLLAPDTYWYIFKSPSLKEKIVGFVYLKQAE